MLEDVYNSIKTEAEKINWKSYNQNELFYEYIKHENDDLGEKFYAGILCRYWGYSGRVYSQCNKHIPFEQCYDIIIDAINYVINKRVWEDPNSSLYGDYTAPDKAFHIALKRQRGIVLSNLTAQKRQANFNTLSIDEMTENYSDATDGLLNLTEIVDNNAEEISGKRELIDFIKSLPVNQIIILDQICFNKWSTLISVINNICKLNDTNFEYYNNIYKITKEDYYKTLAEFYRSNNKKILIDIKRVLNLAKVKYFGREN